MVLYVEECKRLNRANFSIKKVFKKGIGFKQK